MQKLIFFLLIMYGFEWVDISEGGSIPGTSESNRIQGKPIELSSNRRVIVSKSVQNKIIVPVIKNKIITPKQIRTNNIPDNNTVRPGVVRPTIHKRVDSKIVYKASNKPIIYEHNYAFPHNRTLDMSKAMLTYLHNGTGNLLFINTTVGNYDNVTSFVSALLHSGNIRAVSEVVSTMIVEDYEKFSGRILELILNNNPTKVVKAISEFPHGSEILFKDQHFHEMLNSISSTQIQYISPYLGRIFDRLDIGSLISHLFYQKSSVKRLLRANEFKLYIENMDNDDIEYLLTFKFKDNVLSRFSELYFAKHPGYMAKNLLRNLDNIKSQLTAAELAAVVRAFSKEDV